VLGPAGYFGGGYGDSGYIAGIDKITFPADTKYTLSATLTSGRAYVAGMANSGVAGYVGGGTQTGGTITNGIDKITFPADTKSTLSETLTIGRYSHTGMANSGVAGYFGGGFDNAGTLSSIDKITFPADTKSTLSATLSSGKASLAGMANSGTAGYFGGGWFFGSPYYLSGIDKITFPADTKSTLSATLTSGRNYLSAMANSGTAGYFGGGFNPFGGPPFDGTIFGIDKITFPADTKSTLSAELTISRFGLAGMANSGTAGYFGGGRGGSNNHLSVIDKITFSADTKSTLSATLTPARYLLAGFADSGVL